MSHFTVMVVTDDMPTNDVLEAALQPFHEYECTGILDEHVVFVDHHDEMIEEFGAQRRTGSDRTGRIFPFTAKATSSFANQRKANRRKSREATLLGGLFSQVKTGATVVGTA